MKITNIKTFLVDGYLLVRVYTDSGIVGNGEAGLWAYHRTVKTAIEEIAEYYIGKDPLQIEFHAQVVTRNTHFRGSALNAAYSAIDIALWDILGKSVNLPVYQLLGGKCRERVRVFANVIGDSIEELCESARTSVEQGYMVLRLTPFSTNFEQQESTKVIASAVELVAGVRDAIGMEIDLGLEIHRNLQPDQAITLASELKPFRLKFYEDPLPPESTGALEYISRHIDIPMAVGERSYDLFQFRELLERKIVAFIRPDLSLAGGFTQVKKIAAIAEADFVQIFPHLMGSPVNTAAFTHLAVAIPNYYVMESNRHSVKQSAVVDQPFVIEEGYRRVEDRPGIGVEIDEKALESLAFQPRQISGNFHSDGSVAH
ncbi:MAG: D-galactonate dehydratase [Candidatus Moanabacter tarae]|uniref:D-galactonate dehydratase n=1 Tax=Candidatus Moanibacter tarae TaxID=2200854 RepID=A0A2Z4AE64_9BACT|nr:MAG: D-galactonate dehydratase [Candidatus Moanabacter tarae]|tara:strand:+ start:4398 stop:5513 length:1116 start_codon:yes stop_codon:yes gene_type:complete